MYEIKTGFREINDIPVRTWKRMIYGANALEVEAGTSGFHGEGSRTYIRIEDMSSTNLIVKELENAGIEIELSGESELSTIVTALEFILKVLKDQKNG